MTLETMTRQPAISAIVPTDSALATPLPRVLRPTRAVPADAVRPTRAEVNLANLRHNLRVMQRMAGGAQVWAVLKADGYGHGAKGVARTLERAGATGICVALLEEGIELRQAGIRVPILISGGYFGRAFGEVLRHSLTPVLHDPSQVEACTSRSTPACRAWASCRATFLRWPKCWRVTARFKSAV
jgi:Alanine racemase, N-terminal domain